MEQKAIAMVRMTQEEFMEAGLLVDTDANGTATFYDNPVPGCMDVLLYTEESIRKVRDAGFAERFAE